MTHTSIIPDLPKPEEINHNTACPWCGADTCEWDAESEGSDHDAPCCGKPVRWDFTNNLLHAERSEADKKYMELRK